MYQVNNKTKEIELTRGFYKNMQGKKEKNYESILYY